MDLALAHTVNTVAAEGKRLDSGNQRVDFACRQAKEQMFAETKLKKAPAGRPWPRVRHWWGGTINADLIARTDRVLTDGFFPESSRHDLPQIARRTGLAQWRCLRARCRRDAPPRRVPDPPGPRNGDRARRSGESGSKTFVHPTAVLFNGGAFKAATLKERVLEVLNDWLAADGGKPAKETGRR